MPIHLKAECSCTTDLLSISESRSQILILGDLCLLDLSQRTNRPDTERLTLIRCLCNPDVSAVSRGALDIIQGLIIMELQQINLLDYSSVLELLTHGTLCVP